MSPKKRQAVSMSEAEVEAFLRANIKVQVATVGKDGAPHLTTLFYVVQDGCIAFWTYGTSQKVKNLERDPRISALVETGDDYADTLRMNAFIEQQVLAMPEQYLWMHKRFKTRPAGEAGFYEADG